MINEGVGERARLDPRARVDYHPGGLIDYYEVIVFEYYIERDRFRDDLDRGRLGQIDFYLVSRAKPVARFDDAVIEQHVAVFYSSLDSRAANVGGA
jgi:hypothetical protein